jgi:outer membrane protein
LNKKLIPALMLTAAFAAQAQTPNKVGVIQVQEAILSTKEGQKAATELQDKFKGRRAELEKKQNNIAQLQDQLKKGGATMSDDAKSQRMRDIDSKTTVLKRDSEDFDTDLQEEEGKLMQELGGKMMKIIEKYATDNGFAVILDVSNPQTPILWRATAVDITAEIIQLYDKANVGGGAAAPAKSAAPATAPSGAPARSPATTPAPGAPKK